MAGKELKVIITAQDGASRVFSEVGSSAQAAGNSVQRAGEDGKKGVDDLSSSVEDLSANFDEAGNAALALGGIISGAFVAVIGGGAKAMWDQVSAVEQATLALKAYETDAAAVSGVLEELISYARSDMGVLFNRTELFNAAQQLRLYGAGINDISGYVETLSRSVGLGLSDWDQLLTVIGRVGSTGRLTGQDFDYLRAAGFDLDESLRNANVSWETLFSNLDKGIPADALAGQADTISGMFVRLKSAARDVGAAFLGVNTDTTTFIEGGLGSQMKEGIGTVTELLKSLQGPAETAGEVFGALAGFAADATEGFLALPDPIQDAITSIAGLGGGLLLFGGAAATALPKIAGLVTSIKLLPAAVAAATASIGPIGWALIAVGATVTAGLAIWGKHKREMEEQKAIADALSDSYYTLAAQADLLYSQGSDEAAKNIDGMRMQVEYARQYADEQVRIAESGALINTEERDRYKLTEEQANRMTDAQAKLALQYQDSSVDAAALNRELEALYISLLRGEISIEEYVTGLEEIAASSENAKAATLALIAAIAGVGQEAAAAAAGPIEEYRAKVAQIQEVIAGVLEITGNTDLASQLNLAGVGNDATLAADGLMKASGNLDTMYRIIVENTSAIASQSEQLNTWITGITQAEEGESRLRGILNEGRITIEQYSAAMDASNQISEANARIQQDIIAIQAMQAPLLADNATAMADYVEQVRLMNDGTAEGAAKQLEALAWMDQGLQQQLLTITELATQMQGLGAEGEASFTAMVDSIVATNPALTEMLITMGYIQNVVRDESGRVIDYTVNLDGADGAMSEIERLTLSIDALIVALGGVPPSVDIDVNADTGEAENAITRTKREADNLDGTVATIDVVANDQASSVLSNLAATWGGSIATSFIDVVTRNGPGMALGGVVQEYASGGVVIRAGEVGPEIAHFANGGTALLPRDGLYSVPSGSYITPNHAMNNSYGGHTFNITVNGGDADQIKRVFTDEITPALSAVLDENRRAAGVM